MRRCRKCKRRRAASQFYDNSVRPCRPCTRLAVLEWRARNPEKRRAHQVVALARKNGLLVRPDNCSKCFVLCVPVAHHANYSKPLLVIWVCDSCHGKIHAASRANGKKGGRPKVRSGAPSTPSSPSEIARRIADKICPSSSVCDFKDQQSELAALIESELVATPIETGWRPIENAPKNATYVLLKLKDGSSIEGHWAQDYSGECQPPFDGWFDHNHIEILRREIKGWMPLPTPPESRKS